MSTCKIPKLSSEVGSESVQKRGYEHRCLGQAEFQASALALTVQQDLIRETEPISNIPYISDMYPEQAGIHKHKLEPHKNRLESTSVPAASDPVAAEGLRKPVSFSREANSQPWLGSHTSWAAAAPACSAAASPQGGEPADGLREGNSLLPPSRALKTMLWPLLTATLWEREF